MPIDPKIQVLKILKEGNCDYHCVTSNCPFFEDKEICKKIDKRKDAQKWLEEHKIIDQQNYIYPCRVCKRSNHCLAVNKIKHGHYCSGCTPIEKEKPKESHDTKFYMGEIKNFKQWDHYPSQEEINEEYDKMTDKIPQMTEEQARFWLYNCVFLKASEKDFSDIVDIECSIREMKNIGVIRKSELETLVEEAEEMYMESGSTVDGMDSINRMRRLKEICDKQDEAIQALKKDHSEFKK